MSEGRYCPTCSYDLRATIGTVCPECGRTFDPAHLTTFERTPSSVRRRVIWAGCTMLVAAMLAGIYRCLRYVHGPPSPDWLDLSGDGWQWGLLGPAALVIVLWPVTIIGVGVPALMIRAGMRRRKVWPVALVGWAALARYWTFLVHLTLVMASD